MNYWKDLLVFLDFGGFYGGKDVSEADVEVVRGYSVELQHLLGLEDREKAYEVLQAVIEAVNDSDAVRTREDFLREVDERLPPELDAEEASKAAFTVLAPKIDSGEVKDFTRSLSNDLIDLWPRDWRC